MARLSGHELRGVIERAARSGKNTRVRRLVWDETDEKTLEHLVEFASDASEALVALGDSLEDTNHEIERQRREILDLKLQLQLQRFESP